MPVVRDRLPRGPFPLNLTTSTSSDPHPLSAASGPLITPPTRPAPDSVITAPISGVHTNTANQVGALDTLYTPTQELSGTVLLSPGLTNRGSIWNLPTVSVPVDTVRTVVDFLDIGRLTNSGVIGIDAATGSVEAVRIRHGAWVENTGTIFARTGSEGSAIGLHSAIGPYIAYLIRNNGDILASALSGVATGVQIDQGSQRFENNGRILAEGAVATGLIYDTLAATPYNYVITNTGTIEARSTGNLASVGVIYVDRDNFDISLSLKLDNSGVIRGDYAVIADGSRLQLINQATGILDGVVLMSLGADVVTNAGRITGAVYLEGGDDKLTNSGVISGSVDLNRGYDQLINTGSISGDVFAGFGNDLIDTTNGRIDGIVDMGVGRDTFLGSAYGDRVAGGFSNDRLEGRGGDDLLMGGTADDVLIGGAGADGLYGELGRDLLITEGADVARGGAGDDEIQTGDLRFARIDGGEGFDHWRIPNTSTPLDLAAALATGRVQGFESLGVHDGAGVVIRAADVIALSDTNALFVSGYLDSGAQTGAALVTLVGVWTEGAVTTLRGASWRVFTSGEATVYVPADRGTLTVTATAPSGLTGLDQITAGPAAPEPGEASGLGYSPTTAYVDQYELFDGERVAFGETWISPNGAYPVFSEWMEYAHIGNDGTIISDGANWVRPPGVTGEPRIYAVNALNSGLFDNTGTIIANGVRNQVTIGVETSETLENTGEVRVTSERGLALGLVTAAPPWSRSIVNSGLVTATSTQGFAMAIDAHNGGTATNSGTLIAIGATGAIGFGAGAQVRTPEIYLGGVVYGHPTDVFLNTGTIRATTTTAAGLPSVGMTAGFMIGDATIRNEGLIEADIAVEGMSNGGANDLTVENTGIMRGDIVYHHYVRSGVQEPGGSLIVVNGGLIDGDIDATNTSVEALFDHHSVTNSGTITGEVRLGHFEDRYTATGSGSAGTVYGYGGDDILVGAAAEDRLNGGDGNDMLTGGAGNDWLDGGSGTDTLLVSGSAGHYRLMRDGEDFILKGADGRDHLTGIEVIKFSDGTVWDIARLYGLGDSEAETAPAKGDGHGPLVLPSDPETQPVHLGAVGEQGPWTYDDATVFASDWQF